jgi:hypothetical protein
MKKLLRDLSPKWWSVIFWILAAVILCGNQVYGQLEVGDISPDFEAPVCMNGDVDGNTVLDIFDIVFLVDIILGESNTFICAEEAGDLTQDGYLNVLDVIGLIQLILGGNQQQAMTYLQQILTPLEFKQLTSEHLFLTAPTLMAWPNPSNGNVHIIGYGYITIYDIRGRLITEFDISGNYVWDTKDLSSGMYVLANYGEVFIVTLLK